MEQSPSDDKHLRRRGPRPQDPEYLRAKGAFRKNPDRDPEAQSAKREKTKLRARDYAGIARRYAEDVVAGGIVASRLTKLACQRHLRDLERQGAPGFPYRFDVAAAMRACARVESLPHIKGKWARKKEYIRLEPWQCFAIAVPFGWVRKDGTRRFREAYLRIPRKNAKSTMAAGVGVHMLLDDGEHGAEVYSGASSEKQAWEVFGPARLMLERSPNICEEFGVEVWAKSLVKPEDNSRFMPMIGDPGDGPSPSCAIIDEYHEHISSNQYDSMATGMGAREQPLILIITTAGTDLASPCYDKDCEAIDVLEGRLENEELFVLIYTIDPDDDWTDPAVLPKANPNFGVSVSPEYLLAKQRDAIQNPAYQNRFKTKHLDVWCGASVAAINSEHWKACGNAKLERASFKGQPVWKGLDLASKTDICASVDIFIKEIAGARHYFAFGRYYLPEKTIEETDHNRQAYQKWVELGHLIKTEGAEVSFAEVREDIEEDAKEYEVKEIRYDAWRASQLAQELAAHGITLVEMPQAAHAMAVAFDELLAALKGGRFHHDENPALAWMAANVVARRGPKGVILPGKDKPEKKIDGIVAIVQAIAGAMNAPLENTAGFDNWVKNVVTA